MFQRFPSSLGLNLLMLPHLFLFYYFYFYFYQHCNDAAALKETVDTKILHDAFVSLPHCCCFHHKQRIYRRWRWSLDAFPLFFLRKLSSLFFHCDDRRWCDERQGRKERRDVEDKNFSCCLFHSPLVLFLKSCYSLIPDDLMTAVTCVCVCVGVCVRWCAYASTERQKKIEKRSGRQRDFSGLNLVTNWLFMQKNQKIKIVI